MDGSINKRPGVAVCLMVTLGLAFLGCSNNKTNGNSTGQAFDTEFSRQELAEAMLGFRDTAITNVRGGASELDTLYPTQKMRKLTLMWRTRTFQVYDALIGQPDPPSQFLDSWVYSVRMLRFFKSGIKTVMEDDEEGILPVAIRVCQQNLDAIEQIARKFLGDDTFKEMRKEVGSYAATHPIQNAYTMDPLFVSQQSTAPGQPNAFAELINIPLSPFRALRGVDEGAMAMHEISGEMGRFSSVIELLPESIKWQLALLMFELEDTEFVKNFMGTLTDYAETAKRFTDITEGYPEAIQKQTSILVEEIDQSQGNLQITLDKAEKTIVALDTTAQSITDTAAAVESTLQAAGDIVDRFKKDDKPEKPVALEPTQSSKPFDVNDYASAAEVMAETSRELRDLVIEIRTLVESDQLANRIDDVNDTVSGLVDKTSSQAQLLSDRLTWRIALLIGLVFIMAVLYRFISHSLSTRR